MVEPILPFSLHNGGTGTSVFLKLKNQISKEHLSKFCMYLNILKTVTLFKSIFDLHTTHGSLTNYISIRFLFLFIINSYSNTISNGSEGSKVTFE